MSLALSDPSLSSKDASWSSFAVQFPRFTLVAGRNEHLRETMRTSDNLLQLQTMSPSLLVSLEGRIR
jgi:hypothetical protein